MKRRVLYARLPLHRRCDVTVRSSRLEVPVNLLPLLTNVLRALVPSIPAWMPLLLAEAVPAILRYVRGLETDGEADGATRRDRVLDVARQAFDAALADVPAWTRISPARRRRILLGMVELALFAVRLEADDTEPSADLQERVARLRLL